MRQPPPRRAAISRPFLLARTFMQRGGARAGRERYSASQHDGSDFMRKAQDVV